MPAAQPTSPVLRPRFVTGSLMRHATVMAGTGAVGLIAVFAVDLINLFYISLLGHKEIAAAVGFAGVVGGFHVSVGHRADDWHRRRGGAGHWRRTGAGRTLAATLGTIPFAWWGSHYSASGVLIGRSLGSAIFGLLVMVVAWRITGRWKGKAPEPTGGEGVPAAAAARYSASAG